MVQSSSTHNLLTWCTHNTQTRKLYNLTIGAEGPDVVEDFLFAEQLKDHNLPDTWQVSQCVNVKPPWSHNTLISILCLLRPPHKNYWDPHPT